MKFYKTYNCVAITFLVAVSGFLCVLILGTDPQGAQSSPSQSASVPAPEIDPTVEEVVQLAQADSSDFPEGIDEMMVTDTMETLGQELSEGDAPILVEADNSQDSANLASTVEVDSGSSAGAIAPNFAGISSGSGSSGTGSNSSSSGGSSSSGSSGIGSSTSSAGTSAGAGSGGSGGSGSSGASTGRSIFPTSGTGTGADTGTTDGLPTNPTDGGSAPTDNTLPEWIQREGIRGGFISSTAGDLTKIPRYIEAMKTMGLNSGIVYGCTFAETPNHLTNYREWFRQFNQAGLHAFAYYAWQPPAGSPCRPVVFADGTEGLFPCPLDNQLWQKYLEADIAAKLARVSLESTTPFEGYFLDMEMYRTEGQPDSKRLYTFDTCFCDSCFSRFILNRTQVQPLPPIGKEKRKTWLLQNGFLPDYYAYLIEQVESRAEHLKSEVRSINPRLLFGVYPALNDTNWVRNAVMRAFGRNSYPVISFSTDTYGYLAVPWGADRIPADLSAYFARYDINGIYAAGYLLRRYTSAEIGTQIIRSYQQSQGYWLFQLSQLVENQVPESEQLAGGSRTDYIQAIQAANASLQGDE